jgi:hypothetical protein
VSSPDRLWAALVVALVLRVVWAALVPVEPVSDSLAYDVFARTLVDHGVYGWEPDEPSAYWPVGTSAIVAAAYLVLGKTYLGVVALNLLASLGMVFFVHRLGTLYFGLKVGNAAAFVVAAWPNLIFFTTVVSSELFFIAFTVSGLYFWERSRDRLVGWPILLCGACWGAALYVRPVILLLALALVVAAGVDGPRMALRATLRAGLAVLLMLAAAAPWSVRNYHLFGTPVLISTNFGPNFWMGNNPSTTGHYMELPAWVADLSETERSDALLALALDHVRDEPVAFVRRTVVKAALLHDRETIGVGWNAPAIDDAFGPRAQPWLKLAATAYWYVVLAAAVAGAAILVLRQPASLLHPVLVSWAYFIAIHAVIVTGDRYHMPSAPFLALLAGVAIVALRGLGPLRGGGLRAPEAGAT